MYDGYNFLKEFFKQGGARYTDAILFNFYGQLYQGMESDLPVTVSKIRQIEKDAGVDLPVMLAGTGAAWNTPEKWNISCLGNADEYGQASLVVKHVIVAQSAGIEDLNVFAYSEISEGFGLTETTSFAPRPAYAAYANLVGLLQNTRFAKKLDGIKGVSVYQFTKPSGQNVIALWSNDGACHNLELSTSQPVDIVDTLSGKETLYPCGGRVIQTVGANPAYVCSHSGTPEFRVSSISVNSSAVIQAATPGGKSKVELSGIAGGITATIGASGEFTPVSASKPCKGGRCEFELEASRKIAAGLYPSTIRLYNGGRQFGSIQYRQQVLKDYIQAEIRPSGTGKTFPAVQVILKNSGSTPLEGYMLASGPGLNERRAVSILGGQEASYNMPIAATAGGKYTVHAYNNAGELAGTFEKQISFKSCRHLTPNLDASLLEWAGVPQWAFNTNNISGKLSLAWDDANLYIGADIVKDTFSQPFTGGDIWKGDSLQIAIDPVFGNKDKVRLKPSGFRYQVSDAADFCELGLADSASVPIIYRWKGGDAGIVAGARLVVKHEGTHTIYEAAVPWKEIAEPAPAEGDTIGLGFIANYNTGGEWKGCFEGTGGISGKKDKTLFTDLTLLGSTN